MRSSSSSCIRGLRSIQSLLAASVIASGCNSSPSEVCSGALQLQIVAAVRDSATGAAAATGSVGAMTRPGVTDSLHPADSLHLDGALHAGVFTLTIERPGYATWTASNVLVTPGALPCSSPMVNTFDVRLQPASP